MVGREPAPAHLLSAPCSALDALLFGRAVGPATSEALCSQQERGRISDHSFLLFITQGFMRGKVEKQSYGP